MHRGSCSLRRPPVVIEQDKLRQDYLRFRISPEMTIAIGTTVMAPDEELKGEAVEMVASRHPARKKWKLTNVSWATPS